MEDEKYGEDFLNKSTPLANAKTESNMSAGPAYCCCMNVNSGRMGQECREEERRIKIAYRKHWRGIETSGKGRKSISC